MKINFLQKNGMSTLILSSLILKYIILFIMSKYFNLKEAEIEIRVFIAILLPIIDLLILWKERKFIWKKDISISKYFFNYIFWHIFIIDCAILISATVGKEFQQGFLEIGIVFLWTYMMVDILLLPFKMHRWEEGNRNFPLKEKFKVIFLYCAAPIYIFYKVLASAEDIFLLIFSGVIVIFCKWFYSEKFLYYNQKKEKEYQNLIDSEKIKMVFCKKLGYVNIMFISMNIAYVIKKVFLIEITYIIGWFMKLLNLDKYHNVILNFIVIILAGILAVTIYIIIDKKGPSYIKKNYEEIEKKPFQSD